MARKPELPYGQVAIPSDLLATALYGLGRYEADAIVERADGLRPSTHTCKVVAWLWENGRHGDVSNVVGVMCAVLRGQPYPGGVGRIKYEDVIDAIGAELAEEHLTPEGGWEPAAEFLRSDVPRGF